MGIELWLPAHFTHPLPQHQNFLITDIVLCKCCIATGILHVTIQNSFSFTIDLYTYQRCNRVTTAMTRIPIGVRPGCDPD